MRPSAGPGAAAKYLIFVFFLYTFLRSVSIQAITKRVKCKTSNITFNAVKASIIPKYQLAVIFEGKVPEPQSSWLQNSQS